MSKQQQLNKLKSLIYVCSGATCVFTAKCFLEGHEGLYDNVILPAVQMLDPEMAHSIAIGVAKRNLFPKTRYVDPPLLRTTVWGLEFSNPIGMAAGFDKDAEAIDGLSRVGFGFVEVGTVTPAPQPGNPKPRLFRLAKDLAIINRYGFNSSGHGEVYQRVRGRKEGPVVGVNLGKNRASEDPVSDYVQGVRLFAPVSDYLVINVSSPNTPGLRDLQKKESLEGLLRELVRERGDGGPPLLLKLSPDLTEKEAAEIASVIRKPECRVDGLVVSNTSEGLREGLADSARSEGGGLSGRPLAQASTRLIALMYSLTGGEVPIVGVGGVFSGSDAYEKVRAGASLVQLYTAFAYHGPPRVARIKRELHELLQADGYSSIKEAVGKDVNLSKVHKKA